MMRYDLRFTKHVLQVLLILDTHILRRNGLRRGTTCRQEGREGPPVAPASEMISRRHRHVPGYAQAPHG